MTTFLIIAMLLSVTIAFYCRTRRSSNAELAAQRMCDEMGKFIDAEPTLNKERLKHQLQMIADSIKSDTGNCK